MSRPATNPRFTQFHKDMQALARKLANEQDMNVPPLEEAPKEEETEE